MNDLEKKIIDRINDFTGGEEAHTKSFAKELLSLLASEIRAEKIKLLEDILKVGADAEPKLIKRIVTWKLASLQIEEGKEKGKV